MEKIQKDENIDDELIKFKDYGFNIDDLVNMLDDNVNDDSD